jgi:uncharacterized protein YkwD
MDRGTRQAPATSRARLLLAGALVLGVLGAGGVFLSRDVFSPSHPSGPTTAAAQSTATRCGTTAGASCPATPGAAAIAMSSAVVTVPPNKQAASSSSAARTPAARSSATPAATSSAEISTPPASAAAKATAATSAGANTTEDAAAEAQVLALINQARATAGLPALTVTSGLEASSSAHNSVMAAGCGLSHQCPGEAAIGARETAAGVDWTACGENIGEGGPVSDTAAAIAQMAVGLTQSMLDEQPPDDGHRMNILSSSYTHIGIAVYRDSSGTVWLTQDFSN